jgi:TP901 family phage tail tape measure protein
MALVDVQFRANANFADLIAQVNAANAAVKNLNTSFSMMGKSGGIDDLVRDFTSGLAASRQYTTETVRLRSEAEKFGEALHKQRLELRDYHREYRNFVSGRRSMISELARQQVMLERSMVVTRGRDAKGQAIADVITPTGLDNSLATKAAVARKELQIMNKVLNDGATSLINWGKNTQWAGRQLTVGLTVPLTLLGGAAAKLAYDLDQQMTRIVKVYGNTINTIMGPAQVGQLRKDLMGLSNDLAKVYGQSAQDTLGLAAEFAAAGKEGADLMQSVTQTTRLATLGEVDRAEAMKATLAIQTAFKSNTEELAESINFLNAVENQTNTTLNDLVEAIPKAGPIVKGLGGDIKELSLLVVAMREGGIPAAEAANALKSGLASLINPTKQAKEMMKSFGIDIDTVIQNADGKLLPMITGFQAELDKLDEFSKQQVIEQIFGKYQFARMGALFANLGRDGSQTVEVMKLMGAEAGELATIADRELGALQNSISGQFNRALEQVKVELAGIGDGFLELATKGLNAINWLFERFDSLPEFIKTGFGGVLTVTAIIGPIIMTTGVLGNLLGYLVKGVAWFKNFGKSGVTAYDHLTKESIAAKLAGETLEKSFYDQATAVAKLDAEITKLIAALSALAGAGKAIETTVSTGAAVVAEKAKRAVVDVAAGDLGGTRGYVINNPSSEANRQRKAGKDAAGNQKYRPDHTFYGNEFNHLYPASKMADWGDDVLRGISPENIGVAGTIIEKGGNASQFQIKMQAEMYADSIVSLSDSDADLMDRRTEMLRGMAGNNSELNTILDNMSDQEKALLLPTKESFERVQVQEAAFWKTVGENADAAALAKASVRETITAGGTYQEAWTRAYLDVQNQHGKLLEANTKHLQAEFRKIVNGNMTVRQKLEAAIKLVTQAQADAVASLGSGAMPGLSTTGKRSSALYLTTSLQDLNVRQQIVAEMQQELAVVKSQRRAQQKVVAAQEKLVAQLTKELAQQQAGSAEEKAAEQKLVAATNKLALERSRLSAIEAVIPDTRGSGTTAAAAIGKLADAAEDVKDGGQAVKEGGNKIMVAGGVLAAEGAAEAAGVVPGGSADPADPKRRGRFSGLFRNKWVAGIGTAAGVGLMTAGFGADGALGAGATIAGGAMTGGMMGSMFGPWGTGIGAAVGAIGSAIPLIVRNIQKATEQLEAMSKVGETAFDRLGASIKRASDIALVPFVKDLDQSKDSVQALMAAFKEAPEGSDDFNFIEMLKGEDDMGNMRGLLEDKIVQLQSAGVEAAKIRDYILAALNASGRTSDASGMIPYLYDYSDNGLEENLKKQVEGYFEIRGNLINQGLKGLALEDPTRYGDALPAAKDMYKVMTDIAATKPPEEFDGFLDRMAFSVPALNVVMESVPPSMKSFAEAMERNGGTSEQVLKAISLAAQGVALDLEYLGQNPTEIEVVFNEVIGSRALAGGLETAANRAFADRMEEVNKLRGGGSDAQKKRNDAAIKAQEDYIDKLRDKYDDQIEAEKEKQEALDEAQEAEKRRLDRQKTLRDLQVSYNEAIASGNFGAAALIKNEVAYTKAEWGREDKERIADKAADDRIEALEKERDAAIEAEQAKLEAMRENQEAMTEATKTGANARYAAEKKAVDDAKAAFAQALSDYPNEFDKLEAALIAKKGVFDTAGIEIGTMMKEALASSTSEGTAKLVFDTIGGNLEKAPWDLLGQLAAAKTLGDVAKVGALTKKLQAWAETVDITDNWQANGGRTGRVGKDGQGRLPAAQLATGGYVAGQGHGTSDDIDAKLSNGEFVMTNASVNYYGKGFMDAINKRRFAAGGLVEGLSRALMFKSLEASTDIVANRGFGVGIPVANDAGMPGASATVGGVVGTGLGAQIAALGARYVGVPYSYTGGSPEDGWGCAPFVHWVYKQMGFNLPGGWVSNSQYNAIKSRPNRNEITAGDLLFFKYANGVNLQNPINHVGLYMGGGRMVHAANKTKGTIISGVDWSNYVAAGRPVNYATGIPNYARGGLVGMIEPGEFMIKKEAAQYYGEGFLNAINQQTYHKGGLVTASGPKHGLASGGGNQYNFTVYGDEKSARDIAREVVALIEQTEKRKRSNR